MNKKILELNNITKKFPGVKALDNVSFDLHEGEVHALVGENGAGKSTLIKCCTGMVVPDEGEIIVKDKSFTKMTPKLADENEIAVIYQELNSVESLSVSENVFLGNEIRHGMVVDFKTMAEKTTEIFKRLDINIDPYAKVGNFSVGFRQMIEIAKALAHNARILIMDEPSASLTNEEVRRMLALVKKLKVSGVAIIYISHRLNEIFEIADTVTVMRDGKKISSLDIEDTNINDLIKLMVGRELNTKYPERENLIQDEILLKVQNVTGNGDSNISFELHKGEILGFGGLIGSGRTELAEILFGMKVKEKGKIFWKDKKVNFQNPKQAISEGIILCPEDRRKLGLFLTLNIQDNISMSIFEKYAKKTVIDKTRIKTLAKGYKEKLAIKTPNLEQFVKNLSGGNQQKVVLAKGLNTLPELIILDEPTRGIDIGTKHEIYLLMNKLIASGKTIIMISSEMEELMGMSDRIIVFAEGHCTGEIIRKDFNQEKIMELASKNYSEEIR